MANPRCMYPHEHTRRERERRGREWEKEKERERERERECERELVFSGVSSYNGINPIRSGPYQYDFI